MYQSKKNGGNNGEIKLTGAKENKAEVNFSPFVIGSVSDKKRIHPISRRDPDKKIVKRSETRTRTEKSVSIITEYTAARRINIILFSVISLIGVFIGIICAKDLDSDRLTVLRESSDIFYADSGTSVMIIKILTSVLYSAIYTAVIFLSGFTVFAPVVSAAADLVKSILFGFMTAVLIFTAGGKFDAGIAVLYILFGISQIMTLILASGEALGFSLFLLKNEESYKKSLSFPNVSLYSFRHIVFLILLSSLSALETIVLPLIYDLMY